MRFPRVKAEGQSFYHCISRVVEGRFIFRSFVGSCFEAEKILSLMRRLEAFSGVRVLTYALMANHFHLLCEVPESKPLSQSDVLERIEAGYGPQRVAALREQLARCAQQPDGIDHVNRLLEPYRKRMNDISILIKELKGRFAQWFNRRHGTASKRASARHRVHAACFAWRGETFADLHHHVIAARSYETPCDHQDVTSCRDQKVEKGLAWKSHEPKRSRDFQGVEPLWKRLGLKTYLKTSKTG